MQGDSGKPRPALVIQADLFAGLPTVVVLPLTTTLLSGVMTRINVTQDASNGLRLPSQIAVDRPQTVRIDKLGPIIGRLNDDVIRDVNRMVAVFLGVI